MNKPRRNCANLRRTQHRLLFQYSSHFPYKDTKFLNYAIPVFPSSVSSLAATSKPITHLARRPSRSISLSQQSMNPHFFAAQSGRTCTELRRSSFRATRLAATITIFQAEFCRLSAQLARKCVLSVPAAWSRKRARYMRRMHERQLKLSRPLSYAGETRYQISTDV